MNWGPTSGPQYKNVLRGPRIVLWGILTYISRCPHLSRVSTTHIVIPIKQLKLVVCCSRFPSTHKSHDPLWHPAPRARFTQTYQVMYKLDVHVELCSLSHNRLHPPPRCRHVGPHLKLTDVPTCTSSPQLLFIQKHTNSSKVDLHNLIICYSSYAGHNEQ